ncbi:MAG TPA: right-handed parallel beta-helix repeat-containing protein [Pirellulales bacterium]|nr:right-handed parallel beta-helix repeat-containing protein [Pirellulales bacterium]
MFKKRSPIVLVASAVAALSAAGIVHRASARDLYVNNLAGDDLLDGGSPTGRGSGRGPVQTLRQALWLANTADRIVLANTGTPYRESVTLFGVRNSGFAERPFIIDGQGAALDGSSPVPADAWQHYRDNVFRFRPERMAYQQLFLDGRPAARRSPATALGGLPALDPLEWALYDGQIYFRVEEGRLPDQYNPSDAGLTVGITLYKVEHVAIANLFVQGYQLDGINLQDVRFPCTLTQISARGNGRSGIAVCGASKATIEACLAGNNGQSQLHLEGPSETHVENCDLIEKTGPRWLKAAESRLYVDGKPVE